MSYSPFSSQQNTTPSKVSFGNPNIFRYNFLEKKSSKYDEAPMQATSTQKRGKKELEELSPLAESLKGLETGRGELYSSCFDEKDKDIKEFDTNEAKKSLFDSKLSYISDNTPIRSEKKSHAKFTPQLESNDKFDFDTPLQMPEENDELRNIAMEKISNIKELSREIYNDFETEETNKGNLSERRISPRTILGLSPNEKSDNNQFIGSKNLRYIRTEPDYSNNPNPLLETGSSTSEAFYSFKNSSKKISSTVGSDGFRLRTPAGSDGYKIPTPLDSRGSQQQQYQQNRPPLTKFTFEKSIRERSSETDTNIAQKLNTSFTLGRHPKLSPNKSAELSFQKEGYAQPRSRSPSVKSSPEQMVAPAMRIRSRNSSIKSHEGGGSGFSSRAHSPKSMKELKSSFTPTPLNESEHVEHANQRSPNPLEGKIKELMEKNAHLKAELIKQAKAMNKYRESANTIKQLQNQVNSLQLQLLQSEINYQTKLNLLKQNQQKFLPNLNTASPDVSALIAQKDKTIEELHNMLAAVKKEKLEIEQQYRDLSHAVTSSRELTVTENSVDPKNYENYIKKLENENKYLKIQLSQSPHQAEQVRFSQFLNLFSSRAGRYLLGIYTNIKNIKNKIFSKKKAEVIQSVEELLDLIEKNSPENESEAVLPNTFIDMVIENCIAITQVSGQDWKESERILIETEDLVLQEFSKIEGLVTAHSELYNIPLSEESIFVISKTQTDRETMLLKKTLREGSKSMIKNHAVVNNSNQSVDTKKKPIIQQVEDIFLSDYSDEEFDVEDAEEKFTLEFVLKAKEFLDEARISEKEIKKMWENYYDESIEGVKDLEPGRLFALLTHHGLEATFQEFLGLLWRSDWLDPKTGLVDWLKLITSIKTKNHLWWKNKIHNASFDLKYKTWNLGHILNERNCIRHMIFENITAKLHMYFKAHDFTETLGQIQSKLSTDFITKKQFRNILLAHKFPLTKFETQLITYLLDQEGHNKIYVNDLINFLETGQLNSFYTRYQLKKGKQTKQATNNQQIFNEICNNLRLEIQQNDIPANKIKDVFKLKDSRFSGLLNYQQFYDCCIEAGIPFQKNEDIKFVFEYLGKRVAHPSSNSPHTHMIEYDKFIELLFQEPLSVIAEPNKTNILEERDYKYQILLLETQLKEAYSRIQQLEAQHASFDEKTRADVSHSFQDKENSSFLANNVGKSFASDKSTKSIMNKGYMFSNERTLKLKVEDLEYENAKLRKMLEDTQHKMNDFETQRKSYEETKKKFEEMKKFSNDIEGVTLRNLETKLENMEKHYILREVELKNELARLKRSKEEEIELIKRNFNHEREDYKKIIEEKNKEINSFRVELEGILTEMETLRKQTSRLQGQDYIRIQN